MRNSRKSRNKRVIRKAAQKRRDSARRQRTTQRYVPVLALVAAPAKRVRKRKVTK